MRYDNVIKFDQFRKYPMKPAVGPGSPNAESRRIDVGRALDILHEELATHKKNQLIPSSDLSVYYSFLCAQFFIFFCWMTWAVMQNRV